MVSCPRQLQKHGRKGSRKLLFVPSLPARRQPRQVPNRNDECSPDIPGWGKLSSSMVKVSGRPPQILASFIEKGKKPSLSKILPESCSKVGGFGDGHSVAASGVFPVGKEEMFLDEIDRLAA